MAEEKEIKVRVLDDLSVDAIKQEMERLFKVKFDISKHDVDVYHDLADDFYFRLNHGLRIRNDHELAYKVLFYLPQRKRNPWFVLEQEFALPMKGGNLLGLLAIANISGAKDVPPQVDITKLKSILQDLGFVEKMVIAKTRWSAKNDDYEICVDSVDRLGLFVEIEAKGSRFLQEFRESLPFRFEEIRHGYTELYAREILKIQVPDFKKRFADDPDWNFLPDQKRLVHQIIKGR